MFKVDELPINRFAASLGLPGAPKIKFLNKKQKDVQKLVEADSDESDGEASASETQSDGENSGEDEKTTEEPTVRLLLDMVLYSLSRFSRTKYERNMIGCLHARTRTY